MDHRDSAPLLFVGGRADDQVRPAVPIDVAEGQAVTEGVVAVLVRARDSRTVYISSVREPTLSPSAVPRRRSSPRCYWALRRPSRPTDHDLRQRIPRHVADGDGGQSPIVVEQPARLPSWPDSATQAVTDPGEKFPSHLPLRT